ncbi:MAG: Ger(x)C family spore germination protein [Oscillospiraceae bacterium]|jgi:Ger(x)C family germination protein|nr:Ger(x)C family spore germination protein [Oscillospiraceae bacterium]
MRRAAAAVILASALCAGCSRGFFPQMSDIERFEIIRVIGVDADAKDAGNVEITLLAGKPEPESGAEQERAGMAYALASESAPTALEAINILNMRADRRQHLGYIDYYIVGEAAARDGIAKYTDFLMRDHETRFSSRVHIARDTSARELMALFHSSGENLEDALDNMAETANVMSNTTPTRVIDMMNMLDDRAAAVLPAIRPHLESGGDSRFSLIPAGYAVLDGDELTGFIEPEYARGYNFLTNRVKSCPVSVENARGARAGFEVVSEDTRVSARFDGNGIPTEVKYQTRVRANIAEQHSGADIFTPQARREFSAGISDVVRSEMESVVRRSLELKLDCARLGESLRMAYPSKWRKTESRWREIYPSLNISVEVETEIMRVYSLREPSGYTPAH